jgi:hypothetical protein
MFIKHRKLKYGKHKETSNDKYYEHFYSTIFENIS